MIPGAVPNILSVPAGTRGNIIPGAVPNILSVPAGTRGKVGLTRPLSEESSSSSSTVVSKY